MNGVVALVVVVGLFLFIRNFMAFRDVGGAGAAYGDEHRRFDNGEITAQHRDEIIQARTAFANKLIGSRELQQILAEIEKEHGK